MSAETKLSKSIREALERAGMVVFRVQSGMKKIGAYWLHFAPKGTPDLCGYDPRDGKFIGLEVKDESEPTKEQLEFIERAKASGCKSGIVRSVSDAFGIVGIEEGEQQLLQGSGRRSARKGVRASVSVLQGHESGVSAEGVA